MKIIVDTREQHPFTFPEAYYKDVEVEQSGLSVGDYSLSGLEDKVAVERKSLPDLVSCFGTGRERFEREMQRGQALEAFAVVVEEDWLSLARGDYRSKMKAQAACQSVLAFASRYRVPFFFAGSRPAAEYITHGFLKQYLFGAWKRYRGMLKAHGEIAA